MEQKSADSDILDALESAGCEDAVDREMERLLDSTPEKSHVALWLGFNQSLRGDLTLSEAWGEYRRLVDAQDDGRRHAEDGDPKAGMDFESAKLVFWMARLVPALLLGHAVRTWREGRKAAAINLLQRASELVGTARGPDAMKYYRSIQARFNAHKMHKEDRDFKAYAIDYYRKNREKFKNKDEAAAYIKDKIVRAGSDRTVRDWLKGV